MRIDPAPFGANLFFTKVIFTKVKVVCKLFRNPKQYCSFKYHGVMCFIDDICVINNSGENRLQRSTLLKWNL